MYKIAVFNKKQNLNLITYLYNLKQIFKKKDIFIDRIQLNLVNKTLILHLSLFFSLSKLGILLRKTYRRRRIQLKKKLIYKEKKNKLFPKKLIDSLQLSNLVFKITNINLFIQKKLIRKIKPLLKKFRKIFKNKIRLLNDFLKILTLYIDNHITLDLLGTFISKLFCHLTKKSHNRFVLSLRDLFRNIIFTTNFLNTNTYLQGIKLKLSGRIQGKTRSSIKMLTIGQIPNQSINKQISFSKQHIFTIYGVFGLKLWAYKAPIN